jgi:hypothetical protein
MRFGAKASAMEFNRGERIRSYSDVPVASQPVRRGAALLVPCGATIGRVDYIGVSMQVEGRQPRSLGSEV